MREYKLENHVKLHVIETDKYKNTTISIRYLLPLEKDKASSRSLLAMMMTNRTKKYPTVSALTTYLDENYGMGLSMNTFSIGAAHLFEINSNSIDSIYIDGEELLQKQVELLQEVIWNPLLDENGYFDQNLWEEAKMILKAKIQRRLDDPSSYAIDLNNKMIGKDSIFSISALGELEDVDRITKEETKQAYLDLLQQASVEIFVIGNVKESDIYNLLSKYSFSSCIQEPDIPILYSWNDLSLVTNEIEKEIDQSVVILSWYTDIDALNDRFYALKLGNIMLGGDSNSLMFRIIREKYSYCYSIFSSIYSMDKILIAYAGISYENKEKVVSLMKETFDELCNGVEDGMLETAKLLYINSLRSQCDTKQGLLNFEYQQNILGLHRSLDDVIAKIQSVTMSEVIEAMKSCSLLGEFVLKEKAND